MTRLPVIICCIIIIASVAAADTQFSFVPSKWVAQHANDADVLILDVRQSPADYFSGHVPNAIHLADNTLRGTKNGIPVQYLSLAMLAELFNQAGVTPGKTVVIYSDGEHVIGATMVAYVLEKMGHPKTMIMDGGWAAYKETQKPAQEYPRYDRGTMRAADNPALYVTLEQVKAAVNDPNITIVDARPIKAYTGEVTTWMRNGHIPGAISNDWHQLVEPDNTHKLKSVKEIQAIMDAKGIGKDDDIILYCGTSREATLEYMVMRHILGYPKVRLYEGSWTEYSAHPELPMVTGPNPR